MNVLAAVTVDGPTPVRHWVSHAGLWRGEHLVRLLDELLTTADADARPTVVVLDNGSIHHARVVRDALPDLAARGCHSSSCRRTRPNATLSSGCSAPSSTALPERGYTALDALQTATDTAFAEYERQLIAKHAHQPRLAAEKAKPPRGGGFPILRRTISLPTCDERCTL